MTYKGTTLQVNGILHKEDYLVSPSGQYKLVLQEDGNLVIYDLRNSNKVIWSSQTYEKAVDHAIMQPDGNFVIYGYPAAVWATNTYGHGTCYITMQDDGNLVVYQISAPVWGSKG